MKWRNGQKGLVKNTAKRTKKNRQAAKKRWQENWQLTQGKHTEISARKALIFRKMLPIISSKQQVNSTKITTDKLRR